MARQERRSKCLLRRKCDTPLGSFAFLICGDLFDEHIRTKVRELQPDWLLHLMARSLEDGSFDQVQWDKEKRELEDKNSELPIGKEGILYVDLGAVSFTGQRQRSTM